MDIEILYEKSIAVMARHDRRWRYSGRIAKTVDSQRWQAVFREPHHTYRSRRNRHKGEGSDGKKTHEPCACVSKERGDGHEEGAVVKLNSEKRVSTGDARESA